MNPAATVAPVPPRTPVGRQSLGINAAAVTIARLLVPALNLAVVVSIARLDGSGMLGRYTVLVTVFAILENLKSLGLTSLLVRDVAAGAQNSLMQYASLIRIGLWGAIACFPLMFLFSSGTDGFRSIQAGTAAVLGLALVPSAYAVANDALFLALGRATFSAAIALGENLVRLALSLFIVYCFRGGLLWLMATYLVTRMLAALVGSWVVRQHLRLSVPSPSASTTLAMMRQMPNFLVIFVSPIVLFKMDVVFLDFLKGDTAVGIYSAAMRFLSVCLILPDGFMTASFASLSHLADLCRAGAFRNLVEGTIRVLGFGLACVAACGVLLSGVTLRTVYGSKFSTAAPVLEVLVWALVPFAVNRALGDAMVARGHQRRLASIVLVSTAVSAALYLLLVPRFTYMGTAWAFTLSIFFFALLSIWYACGKYRISGKTAPLQTVGLGFLGLCCSSMTSSSWRMACSVALALIGAAGAFSTVGSLMRSRRIQTVMAAGGGVC